MPTKSEKCVKVVSFKDTPFRRCQVSLPLAFNSCGMQLDAIADLVRKYPSNTADTGPRAGALMSIPLLQLPKVNSNDGSLPTSKLEPLYHEILAHGEKLDECLARHVRDINDYCSVNRKLDELASERQSLSWDGKTSVVKLESSVPLAEVYKPRHPQALRAWCSYSYLTNMLILFLSLTPARVVLPAGYPRSKL